MTRRHGMSDLEDIEIHSLDSSSRNYSANLRILYPFFRSHSDGRYTSTTMEKLARLSVDWDSARGDNRIHQWPVLAVATKPYEFDEETETKTGGKLGAAVTWTNGTTVLAVHKDARRNHIATGLLERIREWYNPVLWVGRQNLAGQMFCLKSGLYVTAMNSQGALRMSLGYVDEDGGEQDAPAVPERSARPLRTTPRSLRERGITFDMNIVPDSPLVSPEDE